MTIDDIAAWVQEVVGESVTVIVGPPNAPAPEGDYICLFPFSESGSCYPIVERTRITNDDVDYIRYEAQTHTEITVSANAFAETGAELLNKIKVSSSLPSIVTKPIMADCGDIRNLTWLNDTEFAPRFQCDFVFRSSAYFEKTDAVVETVSITGELDELLSSVDVELSHGD